MRRYRLAEFEKEHSDGTPESYLGLVEDPNGPYCLYSEAKAEIDAERAKRRSARYDGIDWWKFN